jgi:putative ABC transport system permease protein
VLLVVTVVMVILAGANAIFTTWATVLDTRRFSAIVRSLGATPRQAVAGLSAAQLLPALADAVIGIPAGRALYGAVQAGGRQGRPAAWSLPAMVAGLLLVVAALTAVPARIGARRPVAEILQSEAA